jgi:hypothetical protein
LRSIPAGHYCISRSYKQRSMMPEKPKPKSLFLFTLLTDQARVGENALNYEYEGSGTSGHPFVVTWIPHNIGNPATWNNIFRWVIAVTVSVEGTAFSFASSTFSGTIREIDDHFGASTKLTTAGISLFILGFTCGPLIWAPVSSEWKAHSSPWFVYTIWFSQSTWFVNATTY